MLIDPGMDFKAIDKVIEENNLYPTGILVTHGHFDHVGSVSFFQKKYGAKFHIHRFDIKALRSVNFFLKIMKIDAHIEVPVPDHIMEEPIEILHLGNFLFEAYNLPAIQMEAAFSGWKDIYLPAIHSIQKALVLTIFPAIITRS